MNELFDLPTAKNIKEDATKFSEQIHLLAAKLTTTNTDST